MRYIDNSTLARRRGYIILTGKLLQGGFCATQHAVEFDGECFQMVGVLANCVADTRRQAWNKLIKAHP
jgi:hypothetical protein